MGGFKRRSWKRICCHACEKGHGVPKFYRRVEAKRSWKRELEGARARRIPSGDPCLPEDAP